MRKAVFAAALATLVVVAFAARLFLYDPVDFASDREQKLKTFQTHQQELWGELKETDTELAELRVHIRAEEERTDRARGILASLEQSKSKWASWFGDQEQQRLNDRSRGRLKEILTESKQKVIDFQRAATRKDWEIQKLQRELDMASSQIHLLDRSHSPYRHYLVEAWEKTKWYLIAGGIFYFFALPISRSLLFFLVAPWLVRGKPLKFSSSTTKFPSVLKSAATLEVALWPGEVLRVRNRLLLASDENLQLGKRLLFDWHFPLTSWFSGLRGLREVRHRSAKGEQIVTLAVPDESDTDFSLVQVPEGAAMIVRPRFLAAVVQPANQKLTWKMRWRLTYLNAWAAAQWRFIEISGPCRVVLFGPPPSRVEVLQSRVGQPLPARRFRGRAIVGFSPDVEYRRIRTESFWRYAIGRQKLLDAHFVGPGLLVCHETQRPRRGRFRRAWGGMLHAFGI